LHLKNTAHIIHEVNYNVRASCEELFTVIFDRDDCYMMLSATC